MIHDNDLTIARGETVTGMLAAVVVLGTTGEDTANFYALPGGPPAPFGAGNRSIDMKVANIDKGDGYPLKARFEVTQSFATIDASLRIRFGVVVAADPNMAGTGNVGLVFSRQFTVADLSTTPVEQNFCELVIPKLPAVGVSGRQFMFLGMDIRFNNVTIPDGQPLFTAGALNAFVILDGQSPKMIYPTGYSFVS